MATACTQGKRTFGKSWLASALGHKACRDNRSVLYRGIPKLYSDLALARGDGRYARLLRALGGVQLLILDDWGLEPLDAAARHDLLEILEERYGRRSTIITSQIPVDKWHEVIGDPTYADAILDRIVHNAQRINLTGHSLRRSRVNKASKEGCRHSDPLSKNASPVFLRARFVTRGPVLHLSHYSPPNRPQAARSLQRYLGARSLAACCAQARDPSPRIDHPTT